ncbi:hypothetical protein PHYC_02586 [Phycisphaerales bacterium]|nr:hypothetical protein PHYC_02586 [Phycisphaerales bacterium]
MTRRDSTPCQPRRAYTLVEVIISITILSVILLGAQSAVLLAAKSVPSPDDQSAAASAAGDALSSLADDIAVATAFSVRSPSEVEFTVPDRTGDDKPDTIRYSWSGKPGQPLTMSINGAAATSIVPAVQILELLYDTAVEALPVTYSEGSEQILYSYPSGVSPIQEKVKANGSGCGAWFMPTLPVDAVSWSITQLEFNARNRTKVDSVGRVEIRTADGAIPSSRVYSSSPVYESMLGATWTPVTISGIQVRGLLPGKAACVTVLHGTGSDEFDVLFWNITPPADAHSVSTTNDGASWTTPSECMMLTVRGRVVQPDPIVKRMVLTSVRYSLRAGEPDSPAYSGSWPVLNRPEVTP